MTSKNIYTGNCLISETINDCLDNKIKNLHPKFREELFQLLLDNPAIAKNIGKSKSFIYSKYDFPKLGTFTKPYWIARGWNETESKYKSKISNTRKKVHSPFSLEFWLNKINPNTNEIYTEIEADYKRNSQRPIRKEYWLEQGFDLETSIEKALQQKRSNDKSGSLFVKSRNKEEGRSPSPRCVEYYLLRGFTEEEATQEISKIQSTFSLEICIEKYGYVEGNLLWQDRQDRWQNTLNSKPQDEIDEYNSKKGKATTLVHYTEKYGEEKGKLKFIEYLTKRNFKIFNNLAEIETYILENVDELDLFLPIERVKMILRNYFWEMVELPCDIEAWLRSFLNFKSPFGGDVF